MKVGLIASCEDRGLGTISRAFHDHLHPDRTLVIVKDPRIAGSFVAHPEWYPGATMLTGWEGAGLDEPQVREFLDGLDVVYSAETFYDWRIPGWAADQGVATVLHAMPEFHVYEPPTVCWAPTTWRLEHLPEHTRLVPIPVENMPVSMPADHSGRLRVVHVAGHRAAADRNGTTIMLRALRYMRERADVTVHCQDPRLPSRGPIGRNIQLTTRLGGIGDRWRLYEDADVLVVPRRYGGLCLPVQEAMACGLAVVMPDCSPNRDWPVIPVTCAERGSLETQAGTIPLAEVPPSRLAHTLDRLARDRAELAAAQTAARRWARDHMWSALRPLYRAELERAASMRATAQPKSL